MLQYTRKMLNGHQFPRGKRMRKSEHVDFRVRVAAARLVVLRTIEDRSTSETFIHSNPATWRQAMFQLLDEAVRGVADPRFIEALKRGNTRQPDELASTLSIYHWQMMLEAAKNDWRQLAPIHGNADETGNNGMRPSEKKLIDRYLRRHQDAFDQRTRMAILPHKLRSSGGRALPRFSHKLSLK